jgi:hypothetical protein
VIRISANQPGWVQRGALNLNTQRPPAERLNV